MKLTVDRRVCLRSGQCTYLHPELFREDADGFPEVIVERISDEQRESAEDAVDLCPAEAIKLDSE